MDRLTIDTNQLLDIPSTSYRSAKCSRLTFSVNIAELVFIVTWHQTAAEVERKKKQFEWVQ